jgi:hypothetical protein
MDDDSSKGWNLEWGSVLHQNVTSRTRRPSEFIYKIEIHRDLVQEKTKEATVNMVYCKTNKDGYKCMDQDIFW